VQLDGVIVGRDANHVPSLMGLVDRRIFGETTPDVYVFEVV